MNIFLTPMLDESKSPTKNPYINDLIKSLEDNGHIVINKNKFSKIGLFNIIFYLKKSDAIYFNWIEDLISTRFGFLQTLYVYFCCFIFKLMGKKIIWTLHNKISHSKKDLFFKIINTYFLLNYSDIVITHSKDGVNFSKHFLKNENKNVGFLHHPIYNNLDKNDSTQEKNYDILIWGAITPYKGVDKFLNHLEENGLLKKYKICILGKIKDENLKNDILKFNSNNIQIINEFVDDKKLEEYILISKVILFTYTPTNTFASGSLMMSLSYGSTIVGPNVGSFKDLSSEGLIKTFKTFDDLIEIIDSLKNENKVNADLLNEFIEINTWDSFGKKLSNLLKKV